MKRSSKLAEWIDEWGAGLFGLVAIAFWLTFLIHSLRAEKWVVLILGLLIPPFGAGYGLLYALGIVP